MQRLAFAARDHHATCGQWPSHAELRRIDPSLPRTDLWQHDFRYEYTRGGVVVSAAGVDGEWGTPDDIASDLVMAKDSPAPPLARE